MVFLRLSERPRRRRRLVPASIEELLANEHMVEHLLKVRSAYGQNIIYKVVPYSLSDQLLYLRVYRHNMYWDFFFLCIFGLPTGFHKKTPVS